MPIWKLCDLATARYATLCLTSIIVLCTAAEAAPLTQAQLDQLITELDDRQRNSGDWKAQAYLEQKETGKNDTVYDAVFYRRDADDKLMILFLKPKSERGKGYLRMDKNLWFYDPRVGKWERRTERERIGGTDSNRADFDESRLAEEYDASFTGEGTLGKFKVWKMTLTAKKGVDVAYPTVKLWVDQATKNILKQQELAASGKLMRTSYYPKWKKIMSESKGAHVWFPEQIRIFDEIEKGNRTTIFMKRVDLSKLPRSIFTKAWLESKSR
ncbi:MAG: outer membrane lipoprotein-sorting protein [Myxococcota bacterium]|nr:outer membrane lipoprotein-sorting protein [Myxococcota bacterium]